MPSKDTCKNLKNDHRKELKEMVRDTERYHLEHAVSVCSNGAISPAVSGGPFHVYPPRSYCSDNRKGEGIATVHTHPSNHFRGKVKDVFSEADHLSTRKFNEKYQCIAYQGKIGPELLCSDPASRSEAIALGHIVRNIQQEHIELFGDYNQQGRLKTEAELKNDEIKITKLPDFKRYVKQGSGLSHINSCNVRL